MSEHTEITDDGVSKVVAFPGHSVSDAIPQSPFEIAKSDKRVCRHHMRVRLDLHQREVSCADCYAVLDPFDYLVNNATVVQRLPVTLKVTVGKNTVNMNGAAGPRRAMTF